METLRREELPDRVLRVITTAVIYAITYYNLMVFNRPIQDVPSAWNEAVKSIGTAARWNSININNDRCLLSTSQFCVHVKARFVHSNLTLLRDKSR